ncbi:MAG: ribosome biogenesis GTPase YlqF [Atopostipes suicloacalis]|nr:ribosome biogenesis GTPase YlqF [Atopostipes suicloacalis]
MSTIQWYPGHMAKATRQLKEKLPLVDIVFELVDARIPDASRNPVLKEITENKKSILILMKPDLADPKITKEWIEYYEEKGMKAITFNGKSDRDLPKIINAAKDVLSEKAAKRESKGLVEKAMRAVTVGVPNVGKSTLINRFAGKNLARTGNRPGMTQSQQWIKYKKEIELLDIPGILWPKFEEALVGEKLALTGAIKDKIFHLDDISLFGIDYIVKHYPGALSDRYHFSKDLEKELTGPDLLLLITEKRGYFDDYERGAEMLLHELRNGILGRMSFEQPKDMIKNAEEINR